METIAVPNFDEAEWESLTRLFTCDEEDSLINHHFPLHHFNAYTIPNHLLSDAFDGFITTQSHQAAGSMPNVFLHDTWIDQSMSCGNAEFIAPMFKIQEMGLHLKSGETETGNDSCHHAKRKHETPGLHNQGNEIPRDNSAKKKPRIPRDAQKSRRNPCPKTTKNGDENINVQSTISSSSSSTATTSDENDCSNNNATNGKTNKASRGPATDSQSLYARRRRERINERLRILQNLVPNGTKVDISTMLEEAVHYVKFLQLQIKLLSSDDMWMYAPIAYNGMDIGVYQKIAPNLCPQN